VTLFEQANAISGPPDLSEIKRKLLAKYVSDEVSSEVAPKIIRRPSGETVPASLFQEEIWHWAAMANGTPSFYNESTTIRRHGDLNRTALERAFAEIIRRHEAWRTNFQEMNGHVVQIIQPAPSQVSIPFIDVRSITASERNAKAIALATEDARRPFDLEQGTLVRPLLITLDENEHLLFVTMHQIITDGVSVYQILPRELSELYGAFVNGGSHLLPELPFQFADISHTERERFTGDAIAEDVKYWKSVLSGELPTIDWPNKQEPSFGNSEGALLEFTISQRLSDEIKKLSRREGVTLYTTFLAAFVAVLFCYTGQEDIITGTVVPAGRNVPAAQCLLGYFLNPIALRVDLSGKVTVRDLLLRCREVLVGALSHDTVPIEYLMRQIQLPDGSARQWPFNMGITLAPSLPNLSSGWDHSSMDCDGGWARWDLYVELSVKPAGIDGRAQFRTKLFTPAVVSKFVTDLKTTLETFLLKSDLAIQDIASVVSA
jgi:hypothetical protein